MAHNDPSAHASADHGQEHGHPEAGLGKYLAVFGMLCVLTLISFGVANSPLMNTPLIGWVAMLAVSCCKALLVILFFMHLKWEANWKYVLTIPASIMSVFLILMLAPDIGCRVWWYSQERWLHAAEPANAADAHGEAEAHGQSDADAEPNDK